MDVEKDYSEFDKKFMEDLALSDYLFTKELYE